jgi:hypothetical protein
MSHPGNYLRAPSAVRACAVSALLIALPGAGAPHTIVSSGPIASRARATTDAGVFSGACRLTLGFGGSCFREPERLPPDRRPDGAADGNLRRELPCDWDAASLVVLTRRSHDCERSCFARATASTVRWESPVGKR